MLLQSHGAATLTYRYGSPRHSSSGVGAFVRCRARNHDLGTLSRNRAIIAKRLHDLLQIDAVCAQGLFLCVWACFQPGTSTMMEDEIMGDSTDPEVMGEEIRRLVGLPALNKEGPLRVFVIVVAIGGLCSSLQPSSAKGGPADIGLSKGEGVVLGAVLASSWCFSSCESSGLDATHTEMRSRTLVGMKARTHFGFVDYLLAAAAELGSPRAVALLATMLCLAALSALPLLCRKRGGGQQDDTIGQLLRRWRKECAKVAPVFVTMAPAVAHLLVRGLAACLHCVPVTRRTARKQLLVSSEPPAVQMKAFLAEGAGAAPEAHSPTPQRVPKWALAMAKPDLVLDWLDASQYIKDLRKIGAAAMPFSRVFSHGSGSSSGRLTRNLQLVGYSTLRMARMRLDCTAMLVWRRFWAQTMAAASDRVQVYIFCDASPTWRGVELWAASFDLYDGERFLRRLFPCVALSSQMVDAVGKTMALLWQIFLLVGPSIDMVRRFCGRVRGIVTDMGVERKICNMPAHLPQIRAHNR